MFYIVLYSIIEQCVVLHHYIYYIILYSIKSIMKNSHCERCSLTFLRRQLPPRPQPWLPELLTTGLQQGLRKAGPLPGIPRATCFAPWVTFTVNALTPVTTGPLCTDLRVCWQHLATCKTRGDFKRNQSKAARAQDLIICCFVPMVGSIIKRMVCPNISRLVNLWILFQSSRFWWFPLGFWWRAACSSPGWHRKWDPWPKLILI